jgi:hypothetical protein
VNGNVTLRRRLISRYKRTYDQRDVTTTGRILIEELTVAQRVIHLPSIFGILTSISFFLIFVAFGMPLLVLTSLTV